jgi:hypothetical protein
MDATTSTVAIALPERQLAASGCRRRTNVKMGYPPRGAVALVGVPAPRSRYRDECLVARPR